ncbi:MAG: CheR family methyltransferase, partial [Kangiellaceae bacterium]|nr:CheR family methyltransferase [Kangiellaceae bacterium]
MNNKKQNSSPSLVCVGASAGGLEALERFFNNCPNNLGVSYVVIQHLSSNYKSMMDDLINRYTTMPVKMIKAGMALEPDTIYLIEAGTIIRLKELAFQVDRRLDGELSLPIDIFLQSLAENELRKKIAVILSGTGSDGSRGAISVNAHGGFVIAQDPADASFDGMPNSVISTGIVDDIQKADNIPNVLKNYLKVEVNAKIKKKIDVDGYSEDENLDRIYNKLFIEFGINFKEYKEATVLRRIERRMQVKHIAQYSDYANLIEQDPIEPLALRRELLIPVTSFFRDAGVFEALTKKVISKLVKNAKPRDEIRVWVPGCSTGEEPYSILMLFIEELEKQESSCAIKVFATDVNPEVIDTASKGVYPESIRNEVPDDYLKKYFTSHSNGYAINSDIRRHVVFAVHNLLTDAPFTQMNLVSCRNTLIYFGNTAQKEAIHRLQYATKLSGYLFLGKSESLSINIDHFKSLDRKYKLFQCINKVTANTTNPVFSATRYGVTKSALRKSIAKSGVTNIKHLAELEIKKHFTPLTLLINSEHEVVHIYGDNTDMLIIKPGTISYHVGSLIPEKVAPVAMALLYRLDKEDGMISSDIVMIEDPKGHKRYVRLTGWRIDDRESFKHYILSLINVDRSEVNQSFSETVDINEEHVEHIKQLELELTATRESLQSTIEEQETTNEELQATNEELMASNEELQSSNEELQSVNEELNTVNAEYHEKMIILNHINADLNAMSRATGIATVFVDHKQQITRFTPSSSEIFKIRKQDVGRPINEIVHILNYPDLYKDISYTTDSGETKEIEVLSNDNQAFLVRIVSYRLPSLDKYGAAISIIQSKSYGSFQSVIDAMAEHVAVL